MKQVYLHALPVRIWHWVNAVCFFVLIVTGAQIRYRGIMNVMSFETAVSVHNVFGFILIGAFLLWAVYYVVTGRLKVYIPDLNIANFIRTAVRQARYYGYGIFLGEPNPHHATPDNKFNPMQQLAYFSIMFLLLPAQIVTGVLLWDLDRFASAIDLVGGIKVVSGVHLFLTLFFTAFLFVHVYLTTLGHTPLEHIKAMFTGYEEEPERAH
jgi:Ni/Fe-hydrogenase b-type cytochrome subunit